MTSMSDELVRWLGEQLDEDELIARAAAEELDGLELGSEWRYDGQYVETVCERTMVAVGSQDSVDPAIGTHIAEHDPARVLREIDAKRQMLAEHAPCRPTGRPNMEKHCQSCTTAQAWDDVANESNCQTLRLLALPYADRPGYREEWRP